MACYRVTRSFIFILDYDLLIERWNAMAMLEYRSVIISNIGHQAA
jgi:hypothetical protein